MTEPISHDVRVPVSIGDTITLWGMFDLHLDNIECDNSKLERDMAKIISDPKAYVVFGGDTLDMMFAKFDPRAYPKMLQPFVAESKEPADAAVAYAIKTLRPLVDTGRVVGFMIGNHEQTYCDRHHTNVTKRICYEFDLPYLGYECFLRFYFGLQSKGEDTGSIRVMKGYLHHGFGSSAVVTKGAIQLERIQGGVSDIDFVMIGHIHRLTFIQDYLRTVAGAFGNGKVIVQPIVSAVCGGYKLRGDWETSKGSRLGAIGAGRVYFDAISEHGHGYMIEARIN